MTNNLLHFLQNFWLALSSVYRSPFVFWMTLVGIVLLAWIIVVEKRDGWKRK